MALKRARARRLNPIRTTGALIVNPRRKRKAKAKVARKKNSLLVRANRRRKVARKKNSLLVRANRRRRSAKRKLVANRAPRKHNRRRRARRANSLYARVNGRKYNRKSRRKHNRKHNRRANSLYARVNRRHKRKRNSAAASGGSDFLSRALSPFQKLAAKFPLVGGFLSSAVGLLAPAGLGAVSVEPTMMAAKYLGKYVPNLPASVFYPGVGLILAALIKSTSFLGKTFHDRLAVAVAAAGGALGYYKYRSGQDSVMAGELGMLEMAGYLVEGETMAGWGEGLAQRVVPFR